MRISVLVPVGNRERYAKCRETIDASIGGCREPDVEWEVVEAFDDSRRGVSPTRNECLARATGDWIAWVDADDAVTADWATAIARAAKDGDCEVIAFGARVRSGNRVRTLRLADRAEFVSAERFVSECLRELRGSTWLWNKAFRRELFDGVAFEGETQEDLRAFPCVCGRAHVVKLLPDVIYEYHRPSASLTHGGGDARNAAGIRAAAEQPGDATWREACALRAADYLRHGKDAWLRSYLRRNMRLVLGDREQLARIKLKALLAAI